MDSSAVGNNNKVKVMATQLLAKFEENAPAQQTGLKRQVGISQGVFKVKQPGNLHLKKTKRHNHFLQMINYFMLFTFLLVNIEMSMWL